MCDFSQYGGASQQLLGLLPPTPEPPSNIPIEQLKQITNQTREKTSQQEFHTTLKHHILLQNHSFPARDGHLLSARSYRPSAIPPHIKLPIYIHFHGGGFLFGTLDSEDATCARTALSADVVVFHVEYRHTPEWKFPTAWNDSEDAFEWVVAHADDGFAGDAGCVVVGGVSAGGQLAAALTLTKKREGAEAFARIKGQVLMIPRLAYMDEEERMKYLAEGSKSSYKENEFAPILPMSRIVFFDELLYPHKQSADDRRIHVGGASPEEVRGLPPTTLGIAGLDPWRDEALLYAELLAENGVATDVHVFKGVPHGFRRFGDKLSLCEDYDKVMHDGIRWALSHPPANIEVEVHVHQ